MLSRTTLNNLRTAYFVSVTLLVLYIFPASKNMISFFMDYEVVSNFTVATIVAVYVAISAYLYYRRIL